MNTNRM